MVMWREIESASLARPPPDEGRRSRLLKRDTSHLPREQRKNWQRGVPTQDPGERVKRMVGAVSRD
jgi:hypothetical protein